MDISVTGLVITNTSHYQYDPTCSSFHRLFLSWLFV